MPPCNRPTGYQDADGTPTGSNRPPGNHGRKPDPPTPRGSTTPRGSDTPPDGPTPKARHDAATIIPPGTETPPPETGTALQQTPPPETGTAATRHQIDTDAATRQATTGSHAARAAGPTRKSQIDTTRGRSYQTTNRGESSTLASHNRAASLQ